MQFKTEIASRDGAAAELEQAVVALYETCYERVARYIGIRIGKTNDATDLASEVFIRALRGVSSYQDTGAPLEAWLFRIAHNITIDYLRKQGRTPRLVQLEDVVNLVSTDSVHGALERDLELSELKQAIDQLPPAQKEVVTLRFSAGLSPDEIAQTLGKKATTVRWLQHAAILRLRSIMTPGHEMADDEGRRTHSQPAGPSPAPGAR